MWSWGRTTRANAGRRAVLVGPYRVHNFGDDLIGAVIAKHLQRDGYEVAVPRLALENAQWLGTQFREDYDGVFEDSDLVVVGGGGIMSDTAGAKPGASYLGIVARAAEDGLLEGKRVVVTGVGAGPWILEKSERLAVEVSALADKVGVRDDESLAHLASIGVGGDKVVCGADLALLTSEYLRFRRRPMRRIGVQFDVAQFSDVHENPAVAEITDAVARFSTENQVVLISNGRHRSQLADSAPACELLRYTGLQDFLPRLAGLRAVFTSHLHRAIAAYSQRIPSCSLYVREKTRRFYEQIGRPERAIDLRVATVADFERLGAALQDAKWTREDESSLRRLKAQARSLLEFV